MDPVTIATSFGTIVSLFASFTAEKRYSSEIEYKEFYEWLEKKRHNEIIREINSNDMLLRIIKLHVESNKAALEAQKRWLIDNVTGGESYPAINFYTHHNEEQKIFTPYFGVIGKNPLFDSKFMMWFHKDNGESGGDRQEHIHALYPNNFEIHRTMDGGTYSVVISEDVRKVDAHFWCRNGRTVQRIYFDVVKLPRFQNKYFKVPVKEEFYHVNYESKSPDFEGTCFAEYVITFATAGFKRTLTG